MKTLSIERKEKLRKEQNVYVPGGNHHNRINSLIHERKRKLGISRGSINLLFVIFFLVVIVLSVYYGFSMMF